ncbi:MAG TPA: hypothetical protein VHE10_03540, partial [Candidatus Paceibacterota bacterium]|nr:hypothetical protein [Candidatus Paceibacterota bacterium]
SASSTFNGNLVVVGNATTTQATTTNLAVSSVTNSLLKTNGSGSVVAAVAGTDYAAPGQLWSTTSSDYYRSVSNFFSTTSQDYYVSQFRDWNIAAGALRPTTTLGILVNASSTINANLVISGNATATQATTTNLAISSVANSLLKTNGNGSIIPAIAGTDYVAPGQLWSTTSTDYYKSVNNFWSTTSALYWDSTIPRWSTTSSDYYKSVSNFWSTTSADYYKSTGNFFSTSSQNYYASQFRDFVLSGGYLAPTTTRTILANGGFVSQGSSTNVGNFTLTGNLAVGGNATATNATTTNLYVSGSIRGAGLVSCSGSSDKLVWNSTTGQFGCGADAGAGGGITAIGAQYSPYQNGSTQTFATTSDANIGLSITSLGDTHTFTPQWFGTLAANRGGTGILNPTAAGILVGSYAGGGWQQIGTSSLGLLTTNVAEGSNLYYTPGRVQTYLDGLDKGYFFSTTSANYYKLTGDFFSTTSQDYYALQFRDWNVVAGALRPTTTLGILVSASSTFNGNLVVVGNATTTQATTTNLAVSSITNSLLKTNGSGSILAAVAGTDYAAVSQLWATTSSDYWESTKARWSTTSNDYYKSINSFFSTTSSDYYASQFRDLTLSGGYLAPTTTRTILANGGFVSQASSTNVGNFTITG